MLNMVANTFCVGDLVSCYSLKRTPALFVTSLEKGKDFKPSNLSLCQNWIGVAERPSKVCLLSKGCSQNRPMKLGRKYAVKHFHDNF